MSERDEDIALSDEVGIAVLRAEVYQLRREVRDLNTKTTALVRAAPHSERQLSAAQRVLKARKAKDSLIEFTEFTMPSVEDPEDANKSRYSAQYFHKALAAALEEVEAGRLPRLIVTFPPRHGKAS
jgi:hypothetical protein